MKFADIILPLAIPQLYTYQVPENLQANCQIGMRAVVQFGKRKLYSGVIYHLHNQKPQLYKTKQIISLLDDKPIINQQQFKLWDWISEYYMCSVGEVMKAALPAGLKLESQTKIFLNQNFEQEIELNQNEKLLVFALKERKILTVTEINDILNLKNSLKIITSLLDKNVIKVEEKLKQSFKPKREKYIKLSEKIKSETDIEQAFSKLNKAPKQEELLMIFLEMSQLKFDSYENKLKYRHLKKTDLLKKANTTSSIVKQLLQKEILEELNIETARIIDKKVSKQNNKKLSPVQLQALEEIEDNFADNKNVLLHGVTSSGKTEVYINIIKKYIKKGKQVLYLLPEIALTTQIINRLKNIFGADVGVYHSKFNDAERVEIWNNTTADEFGVSKYKIVLGVRSSIFLPFNNLGLIIIDEEHENTYKQFDPAPRYNARDAAYILAKNHGAKILLGTATPSIETYYNVLTKKLALVELTERHQNIEMPQIIVADTKKATQKKEMKSIFHPILVENIQKAIANNEQVILFQNRRGFAPFIECKTCGWIPKCEHCDVSLTYHKFTGELTCHYCGYSYTSPSACLACGDTGMETKGLGTQKIEEEIKLILPKIKVARMDLDTTRGKNGYQKLISQFENRKIDLLIGTQMVSKGLDFDNVSIVGIMSADNLLNFPDFRAYERSYQLMAQVSGRAGRKNKQGKVIIQSSQPNNKIIKFVRANAYRRMFKDQIEERRNFKYPPFYRLIKITVKHKNQPKVDDFALLFAQKLRKTFAERVLGPEYPIISRIQNWYLKDIMLKLEKNVSISEAKKIIMDAANFLKAQKQFSSVQIIYNADPF